jgi:pimeloyl-ACP methyl ester carboxylesterase
VTSAVEPVWFTAAVGVEPTRNAVDVAGTRVAYRSWGEGVRNGLVLVHGGGAHSGWWDHIAPMLASGRRVVALDLSGHGDSDHRASYDFSTWAAEVMAVAQHANVADRPTVIGHSMGGFVALVAAIEYGSELSGAMTIDTPVCEVTPEDRAARQRVAFGPRRSYATREEALARFRAVPAQEDVLPFVMRHIAAQSIRPDGRNWTWKYDPAIFARPSLVPEGLDRVGCRLALLRGENGLVPDEINELMYDRLGRAAAVVEIPAAGHHVMLDQPLSLVTGLRALLSAWNHSVSPTQV